MGKFKTFITNNNDGFIALLFSIILLFLLSFKIDIINLNLTNFQWAALIMTIFLVLILLWKKFKYFWNNLSTLREGLFWFWLIILIFSGFISIYTYQYQISLAYSMSWAWENISEIVFLQKICLNFHWWFFLRFIILRFICFLFSLPDAKNE